MKKTISLLVVILAFSPNISAQGLPVYDNTNFLSLAKSIIESAKQTTQLMKTVQFLKQQKDNLVKVNNMVKQLKAVRKIASNNERLFNLVRRDLREILDSPYIKPQEIDRVSYSFNLIIENSLDGMEVIEQILSNNLLKMTDADRTKILKEMATSSEEMVAIIHQKTKRYREIIAFRKMQDLINNRETNF